MPLPSNRTPRANRTHSSHGMTRRTAVRCWSNATQGGMEGEMIGHSTRIGRLFGVDLRIDLSWMFIFILLTWNLFAVFSTWHPDWTPAGIFAVALAAALLFFVCILLHELAHSLVAIAHGTRVRSITLFLFGGVSDIEREPRSPSAEFLTAIVGP